MNRQKNNQSGFTLLEALVTISIVLIVATYSLMSFKSWSEETSSRAAISALRSSLSLARMEAIKRGGWVRLCGSAAGSSCDSDIGVGWVIYHDSDGSGLLDNNEEVLVSESINTNRVTLALTDVNGSARQSVGFDYRGYTNQESDFVSTSGERDFQFRLNRIGRML